MHLEGPSTFKIPPRVAVPLVCLAALQRADGYLYSSLQLQEPLASSQLGATITLSLVFEFYPLRKLPGHSGLRLLVLTNSLSVNHRAVRLRLALEEERLRQRNIPLCTAVLVSTATREQRAGAASHTQHDESYDPTKAGRSSIRHRQPHCNPHSNMRNAQYAEMVVRGRLKGNKFTSSFAKST